MDNSVNIGNGQAMNRERHPQAMDPHMQAVLNASACILELDAGGRILSCRFQKTSCFDRPAKDMKGRPWQRFFVPVQDSDFKEMTGTALGERVLTCSGKELFLEWTLVRVSGPGKVRTLGVGQDVTFYMKSRNRLRMELQHQLQHADRLATVGQLAAGIAHELNGPLSNILGYAQLAAKAPDLPEQVYQDLDHIVRFSLHTREIVKKIMLFSRQTPPRRERICLNKVVRDSIRFTEPLCTKKQIRTDLGLAEDLPELMADASQIHQVVVNLIVNAAQAMPVGGGTIRITTEAVQGGGIRLMVADTGSGMSEETLAKCFIPFFTTKDVDQGTGLGLSVVHGIIQSHGADIRVDSWEGKGSCFEILFADNPEKGDAIAG